MSANEFTPDYASPPGETIQDILDEREIEFLRFRLAMGLSTHQVDELLAGRMVIDKELAEKLARVLGSTPVFWARRDEIYRADLARLEKKNEEARARIGYRAVEPIGARKAWGHLNKGDQPHEWGEFEEHVFPDSWEGKRMEALRRELKLTMRDVMRRLGLKASEVSNLEKGRAVANWQLIADEMRSYAAEGEWLVKVMEQDDGP